MERRDFLRASAAIGLTGAACKQARVPPSRAAVLTALVHEVVVPDAAAVIASSIELRKAASAFANAPAPATLRAVRSAFVPALLAWKRAQCFRNGPMVETNAFVRTLFWPPRPAALEAVLSGSAAIDSELVAGLGVDARGLYALELLLFPENADEARTLALFGADARARRGALAEALATSIVEYAERAGAALGDGTAYAARFAKGAQVALSMLVNQMIGSVENLAAHRLEHVLGLEKLHRLVPLEVEGWPSGTSQELALAQLQGNERLYRGGKSGGLAELTSAAAPDIEAHVSRKYDEARAAVRALGAPLERVVTTDHPALVRAAAATKALEIALKVELSSALGVTITFQTGDGD
ncbi:MAG TPA: imelysin family protein [Polyangiaceae bacterium]|nr:imelysin family protein [Polyangiaceae bacterium]